MDQRKDKQGKPYPGGARDVRSDANEPVQLNSEPRRQGQQQGGQRQDQPGQQQGGQPQGGQQRPQPGQQQGGDRQGVEKK